MGLLSLTSSSANDNSWDASKIPPLDGKVAVVTGANSGIGFEVTRQLALHGASVFLACRSESRGREAVNTLRAELFEAPDDSLAKRGGVELLIVDMGEPESVQQFAAELRQRVDHIDMLVNNAGVASPSNRVTKSTGLESQFAINYLGHFQLTALVMDLLEATAALKDGDGQPARVVNMSSLLHYYAWPFWRVDALGDRGKGHIWGYNMSKLALLMFTFELDRRLRARLVDKQPSVVVTAVHPGASQTPIFNKFYFSHLPGLLRRPVTAAFDSLPLNTIEMAALPALYAATAPEVKSGGYYGPDGWLGIRGFPCEASASGLSRSESEASKLWAASERLLGMEFPV